MACLLGVCDAKISSNCTSSSQINKIGGNPNWQDNVQMSLPSCQVCNKVQFLVVQLYCCLEKSIYHRTLYVFACRNRSCWNKDQSWTVYRCQSFDSWFNTPAEAQDSCKPASTDDWGVESDDWGKSGDDWGNEGHDWGNGGDDWNKPNGNLDSAADDWGDATDDWGNNTDETDNHTNYTEVSMDMNTAEEASGLQNHVKEKQSISDLGIDSIGIKQLCLDDVPDDVTDAVTDAVTDDVPDDVTDAVTDDVIDDDANHVTDDIMIEENPDNTSNVLAEDMPSLSEQEKLKLLHTLEESSSHDTVKDSVLESYFMNVFEEPSDLVEDNYHIAHLIKDYQKREGCNVKDLLHAASEEGGGKTEKYEKTALLHRDLIFHKFIKRLSICPEQCIRYQWNGSPMFNSSPSGKLPSSCCHCGGEVVFELQLTPALINHLRYPDQSGPAVEFGTVLVYTCKQSCWDKTDSYRTEYAVVQADPDQHLFKNN